MKFYEEEKIIFYLNTHSSCARQLVTNSGNFLFPQERIEGEIMVQTSKTTWCMCNLPIKRMRKHETKSVRCEKPRSGKKTIKAQTQEHQISEIHPNYQWSFCIFYNEDNKRDYKDFFFLIGKKVIYIYIYIFDKLGKKVILLNKKQKKEYKVFMIMNKKQHKIEKQRTQKLC